MNLFTILVSDVTENQLISAGYPRGIDRVSLDGSQVLIGGPDPLPASLDSFAVIKDQTVDQIFSTLRNTFWHSNDVGAV